MAKDIRLTRKHLILETRADQLALNQLVLAGGEPYIDKRLSRLPFESEVSWSGKSGVTTKEGRFAKSNARGGGDGRKSRAFLVNYAARIASKINQYVFSAEVKRENVDKTFLADATRTGMSLNDFMRKASQTVTGSRWCWIGVDRDRPLVNDGVTRVRSVADKEKSGDRVYWTIWSPTEVVDWHFDQQGNLVWLITEQTVYNNEDYTVAATKQILRTIWQAGGGIRLWLKPDKTDEIEKEEIFSNSAEVVPFVLAGIPSADPWWFDDVEAIQASLLNLESVHNENLFQSVYPQMVLPAEILTAIANALSITAENALELVRGLNYPILEPTEASGLTRYIMPSADGLKSIPDEIMRRRKELFEVVGLAMQNPDTRQVASAEAKAWDHLDPEAVLRERAILLEETEKKAVVISRQMDSTFSEYAPEYGKSFDISDVTEDMQTVVGLNNMDMPFSARKELMRAAIEIIDKMTGIPDERKKIILAEIDGMKEPEMSEFMPPVVPGQVEKTAIDNNTPNQPGVTG